MNRIVIRPGAARDLVEIFRYLARTAGLRVADRFVGQAQATWELLVSQPRLGSRYDGDGILEADLRYYSIIKFRNYIAFYRPIEDRIEVIRVLHGARDIASLLRAEFNLDGDDNLNGL